MSPRRDPTKGAPSLLERLSPGAASLLRQAARSAEAEGRRLYLVGGIVRDLLLGRPDLDPSADPSLRSGLAALGSGRDLDVVVEGDAVAVARALAARVGGRLVTHQRFGTASLTPLTPSASTDSPAPSASSGRAPSGVEGGLGLRLDLATARTESYPYPGSLPVVKPGAIADDLSRRDFTINAMAVSLNGDSLGELIDPLKGLADLRAGLVRVIHDRSFIDDGTRILRAVRYEQRFGFRLEEGTEKLLRRDAGMLAAISADRVRHEVRRILEEERPEKALERAHELGALRAIHAALHWDPWLAERFIEARDAGAGTPALCMALLMYRLGETDAAAVAERLRFPGSWGRIIDDARRLGASLSALEAPDMARSAVYRTLRDYSPEAIRACRFATSSAIIQRRLKLYLEKLRLARPLLGGEALMALGVPQGPAVGMALEELHRARLDGEVRTRAEEAALVQRWLAASPDPG